MSRTVEAVYHRLAPIYDIVYGTLLQPGRSRALARLAPRPGESILEIGVGTGFGLGSYPDGCRIVGIDVSSAMIGRAQARLMRLRARHITLCRMDAARLAFGDEQFDAIYAPYLINVVADPIRVAREMLRVCRPSGRVVLLNHFKGIAGSNGAVCRVAGRLAERVTEIGRAHV